MKREGSHWRTAIGVEVHVQLRTATKMFCRCPSRYGAPPNVHVCPVCLGLPGALPVVNRSAVEGAVRTALVLGCRVRDRSRFVRKHYFYPDLPKGYQITQYAEPLAAGGAVVLREGGEERRVRIRRLHLEEDAGRSRHDLYPGSTAVDLNRAGVPLVEVVTEPDLGSPEATRRFLVRLKQLVEVYAGTSDCNMEEGSLRVDANLSVRREDAAEGVPIEVKNVNSFSHVEKALAFERGRQIGILSGGGRVVRETRRFDEASGETRPLRGKEAEYDYRYFPEPDIPPLSVDLDATARVADSLGEPPHEIERRLHARFGLSEDHAAWVAATPERARYFDEAVAERDERFAKAVAHFMMGGLAAALNRRPDAGDERQLLEPAVLARLTERRLDGTLSSDTADRALDTLIETESPSVDEVIEDRDLAQIRDPERLRGWVASALRNHPEEVARWTAGERRLTAYLMGEVMRLSGGRADPTAARRLLEKRLEALAE